MAAFPLKSGAVLTVNQGFLISNLKMSRDRTFLCNLLLIDLSMLHPQMKSFIVIVVRLGNATGMLI